MLVGAVRPPLGKVSDEVRTSGSARREMDPARAIVSVGGDNDLVLETASPLLGNERVDLAWRAEPDERELASNFGRNALGEVELAPDLFLGLDEESSFSVLAGQQLLWTVALHQQGKGGCSIGG